MVWVLSNNLLLLIDLFCFHYCQFPKNPPRYFHLCNFPLVAISQGSTGIFLENVVGSLIHFCCSFWDAAFDIDKPFTVSYNSVWWPITVLIFTEVGMPSMLNCFIRLCVTDVPLLQVLSMTNVIIFLSDWSGVDFGQFRHQYTNFGDIKFGCPKKCSPANDVILYLDCQNSIKLSSYHPKIDQVLYKLQKNLYSSCFVHVSNKWGKTCHFCWLIPVGCIVLSLEPHTC